MRERAQRGVTLVTALVTMFVVLTVGIAAAELAWQGEKAARAERDRHLAFQAAEAALDDAEWDIRGSAPASGSHGTGDGTGQGNGADSASAAAKRGALFASGGMGDGASGFAAGCAGSAAPDGGDGAPPDQSSGPDPSRGLMVRARGDAKPVWQVVDLSGSDDGGACSVQYGDFTGAAMETGQGFLPFKRPRYIVERMECHMPGEEASAAPGNGAGVGPGSGSASGSGPGPGSGSGPSTGSGSSSSSGPGSGSGSGSAMRYCYRVTAIGFGAQPETQVVLQSIYRRPD